MIYTSERKPLRKRIPVVLDTTVGIQRYGADNLYPQHVEEIRDGSYTAASGTGALSSFIFGEGFLDPALATLVVNDEGQTLNEILRLLSEDKGLHRGCSLHVQYNLNMQPINIEVVSFAFVRYGIPDERGNVFDMKVNTNWEKDIYKELNRGNIIDQYPIFNNKPEVIENQLEIYGDDFPGQLLYEVPRRGLYPKATIDPVLDQAQTQEESAIFDLASIQNGFTAATIFKYPGTFKDNDEKEEVQRKLNKHKGAAGAKSVMVVENPTGEDMDLVESIQMQNTDKMFEGTDQRSKRSIRECLSQPMEILGVSPETGMFNKQNIIEAFNYYNMRTNDERMTMSTMLKRVMSNFKGMNLESTSFEIKKKVYV